MTTKYFLLSKPTGTKVNDNTDNQIHVINSPLTCILPYSNLEYYYKNGLFEGALIEWSKQFCNKNRLFLDIGAHTGTYTLCLADLCKQVYSFEPQRQTYYALCGSVALSNKRNVECVRVGLGSPEQVGKQTLNIVSNDGGGSSVQPQNMNVLDREEIEIRTLDSFQLDDVGFIKMDIEGNELDCLNGSVETIKRSGYPIILFESNTGNNAELFNYIVQDIGYREVLTITGVMNMFLAVK